MTRTFSILATLLAVVLLATFAVGWWSFFLRPAADDVAAQHFKQDVFLTHFSLGLGSALGILLVHCLIFTYFLGTGRWVKEVTLTYGMPDEPWHRATR